MTHRFSSLGIATVFVAATCAPSLAARADQAEDEAAALMNAAADAYQKGDYGTCRDKAGQAWAKFQHAQISGLLGSCEVKLGMYAEGATHLDFYLKSTTDQPNPDAKQLLEEAKQHVSEVTLACHPEGVVFKIDGKPLSTGNSTVFIPPGQHVISAEKPGYETKQAPESVAAGAKMTVNIELELAKTPRPIVPGIVGISVGVVALAIGGGLIGKYSADRSGAEKTAKGIQCSPNPAAGSMCKMAADQIASANATGNAGAGLLIGGGVVAAAGTGLLVWALMGPSPSKRSEQALVVVPVISPGESGVVLRGAF